MSNANVAFVLNAHLPFVRHPEYPRFLEEDWLFESISESYLPLLRMLNRLKEEGLSFQLTISFSPPLIAMLTDNALQNRFVHYLQQHIELGQKEVQRCKDEQPQFLEMAQHYLDGYIRNLHEYEDLYRMNILDGFKALEQSGHLELITTAATHAYLPLYEEYPQAINAQIELGVQSFLTTFGHPPKGFWLPECGYYPGLEEHLKYHGIKWFQVASQSMLLSPDKAAYGGYRPVRCPSGVAAFPRDYQATSLVWSNTTGYPTDNVYREFYRDIGYDLSMNYIRPYIHEPEVRVFTGYKYWAITGDTDQKVPYVRAQAMERVKEHAKNFHYVVNNRNHRLRATMGGAQPLFFLGFDAELFGHWWYEGIDWLEEVIRTSKDRTKLVTPSFFLAEDATPLQTVRPAFSSWGQGGYSAAWLDGSNTEYYRHIHKAITRMEELASRFPDQTSLKQRFLNQAAREVLLAMSSDWPFIIYCRTSVEYAKKRIEGHLKNVNLVYDDMCKNAVDTEWLVKAEKRHTIFGDIDYNIFNSERI